jgi:tRNA threonylcarbamoyladenosine biosynthesis protein TsaE
MGGDVIELKGDLGSGKTTLAKGILQGRGFRGDVVSPTYTLSRTYTLSKDIVICHFDFYRLQGHDTATKELQESLLNPQAISIIEWPGRGHAKLPTNRLCITLTPAENAEHRTVLFEGIGERAKTLISQIRHDYRD